MLTSFYSDEREQYFSNSLHPELYADRMKALSFAFAGALRINGQLSLGFGATLDLQANVSAPVFVADAGKLQDLLLDTDAKVNVSVSPHGGIAWRPWKRLHLTATAHAPQKVELNAKFKFLLATGVEQSSSAKFVSDYTPWRAGAGAGWDFWQSGDASWTAVGSLTYARWSHYIDRHGVRPSGAYTWQDTLSGALGLRCKRGSFAIGADLQYQPTPVPAQSGRTNYVDSDRLGSSLSSEYSFAWLGTVLRVGAQLQLFRLLERAQKKLDTPTNGTGQNRTPQLVADEAPDDARLSGEPVPGVRGLQTNNPGWPGFSSAGWVAAGGLYLSMAL